MGNKNNPAEISFQSKAQNEFVSSNPKTPSNNPYNPYAPRVEEKSV